MVGVPVVAGGSFTSTAPDGDDLHLLVSVHWSLYLPAPAA